MSTFWLCGASRSCVVRMRHVPTTYYNKSESRYNGTTCERLDQHVGTTAAIVRTLQQGGVASPDVRALVRFSNLQEIRRIIFAASQSDRCHKPAAETSLIILLAQHQSCACCCVRTLERRRRSMMVAAQAAWPASRPIPRWARHKQGVPAVG